MKKINTYYWIVTVLFAAFMTFTAIPDVMNEPNAVAMIHGQLGYPKYFVPFIGVVKLLGVIAILIPGYPRIKEWAYAGLFFDLVAATYSVFASGLADISVMFMLLPFSLAFGSYFLYHKKLKAAD